LRSNLARLLGSRIRQHGVLCQWPWSMCDELGIRNLGHRNQVSSGSSSAPLNER
ncbi:hypothetical protein K466DRAFT_592972, partial [Polyporus arcularius HHB13444]